MGVTSSRYIYHTFKDRVYFRSQWSAPDFGIRTAERVVGVPSYLRAKAELHQLPSSLIPYAYTFGIYISLRLRATMTPKREESSEMPTDPVALNDRLDDLWAQYLELLDRYQSAQRELQKSMASVSQPDTRVEEIR